MVLAPYFGHYLSEFFNFVKFAKLIYYIVLAWLWWGYKLSAFASAGRSVGATVAQHALVSGLAVCAVLLGLLYVGVIPGVDMQAANALVSGALEVLPW